MTVKNPFLHLILIVLIPFVLYSGFIMMAFTYGSTAFQNPFQQNIHWSFYPFAVIFLILVIVEIVLIFNLFKFFIKPIERTKY